MKIQYNCHSRDQESHSHSSVPASLTLIASCLPVWPIFCRVPRAWLQYRPTLTWGSLPSLPNASPSSLSAPADLMHCYHSYLSKAQPSINMLQNYQWVPHAYRIKPKLLLPGIHRPLWSGSYQLFRLMSLSHLSLLFFRKTDELPTSYVFPSSVPLLTLFLLPKMLPSQFFFILLLQLLYCFHWIKLIKLITCIDTFMFPFPIHWNSPP